jgi:hypothetical protein
VTGNPFQHRRRGIKDADVLGAQQERSLLDEVLGVGFGLLRMAGSDAFLDPARVHVNRELDATALGDHLRDGCAGHMGSTWEKAEPVHVSREPVCVQLGAHPRLRPVPPVTQDNHAFRDTGRATTFEDADDIGVRPVSAGDEVFHPDVAQFVDDIGEQRQILDTFHILARVEVQGLRPLQPVRRTGFGIEVPLHGGTNEFPRIHFGIKWEIQER